MANDMERYDAIVIGAGQSGGPLASALAKAGKQTAIIEREHYGGTCINEGCTPTKTMVASARVAYLARRAADYGVQNQPVTVDMTKIRDRKRAIVESFRSGSEQQVRETNGLDAIDGDARFTGEKTLTVALTGGGERVVSAEWIFVNAGAKPMIPNISGLQDAPYLDSTSIMELDTVPSHLAIIGGGYISVEFAQMFRRFGARVTMLVRGDQILSKEDPDVCRAAADILTEDGISIRYGTDVTRVARHGASGLRLTVSGSGGMVGIIDASHLLVATGRQPNTDRLDPSASGIEMDKRGNITVNERLETNAPGIWALGDIHGGPAFTHVSYDDFRIVTANLLNGGSRSRHDYALPYVVYMDPQLGRVGLTEKDAREQGHDIRVASMPMSSVARALETDETRGMMKVVIDAKTDHILGASILGLEGGELMSMLQIAMMGKLTTAQLRDAVLAHPTLAESFNNLFA